MAVRPRCCHGCCQWPPETQNRRPKTPILILEGWSQGRDSNLRYTVLQVVSVRPRPSASVRSRDKTRVVFHGRPHSCGFIRPGCCQRCCQASRCRLRHLEGCASWADCNSGRRSSRAQRRAMARQMEVQRPGATARGPRHHALDVTTTGVAPPTRHCGQRRLDARSTTHRSDIARLILHRLARGAIPKNDHLAAGAEAARIVVTNRIVSHVRVAI